MRHVKIYIFTAIISLVFGLLGGYIFYGASETFKQENKVNEHSKPQINIVDYPKIESSNYEKVIEKAFDTVVEIRTTVISNSFFGQSEGQKLGSGVIVTADGYIVTNNHVIEGATNLKIVTSTAEEYDAVIIGSDSKSDLAVIKIDASDLKFASIADSDLLRLGQETIVIGNPLGEGISCSNGIVSALAKDLVIDGNPMSLIQTNAAVNQGNSGGGLFNMNGDLIGIVNAKSSSSYFSETTIEGVGYAIPSNTVSKIMSDLLEYGYVKQRATLGVTVYNYPYQYNGHTGLLIESVIEDTAADKAGIKRGDLIISIDDTEIDSYATLNKILLDHDVNDVIKVTVIRDGKEITKEVTLLEANN